MASCDRQTGDRPSSRQSDAKESIELIHTKATEDDAPIDLSDRGDEDLTPQPVVEEAQDPNLVRSLFTQDTQSLDFSAHMVFSSR